MEGRGRSSSIPWDYVNSKHNSPVMMVPGLLMGTGLTLITPRTDPLSDDRNITAICRLVIIGGHGSLMTSPRAQDDGHEMSGHLHLHPRDSGRANSEEFTAHPSRVSLSHPNLIDHKTNPCRSVCFLMFHSREDVGWHPGTRSERGSHTSHGRRRQGRLGGAPLTM